MHLTSSLSRAKKSSTTDNYCPCATSAPLNANLPTKLTSSVAIYHHSPIVFSTLRRYVVKIIAGHFSSTCAAEGMESFKLLPFYDSLHGEIAYF